MSERALKPHAERSPPIPPAVADQIVRKYKARHYESWLDMSLPVLDGLTPRQAVRRKAGRERVDVLLKEIKNHENRQPGGPQVDLCGIRAQLGLD